MNKQLAVLMVAILCLVNQGIGQADPINHGTFMGNSVTFIDVTEDSGTDPDKLPLFGPPSVFGNTLDFDPVSFNSFSEDGGFDQTDGALRFSIQAKDGQIISVLKLEESGDFSLIGPGGMGTFAQASVLGLLIEIVEVDNVGIDPIKLDIDPTIFSSVNLEDDGNGQSVQDNWGGEILVNITDALLMSDQPFDQGATRLGVIFNNSLVTLSEEGTSSLIAKKDDGVRITVVPEPSSMSWVLILLGWSAGRSFLRRSGR